MNTLARLQQWYLAQCNGRWEHEGGVTVTTLDNPGWRVDVNLRGTRIETKPFGIVARNVSRSLVDQAMGKVKLPYIAESPSSEEWIVCFVKEGVFEGSGDGLRLEEIISVFLNWAEGPGSKSV